MFFPIPKPASTTDVCSMCGEKHVKLLCAHPRVPAKTRSTVLGTKNAAPSAKEKPKVPLLGTGLVPPRRQRWLSPRSEKTRQSIEIRKLIGRDLAGEKLPPIAENANEQPTIEAILGLTQDKLRQQPLWLLTRLLHNVSGVVAEKTALTRKN